MAAEGTSSLTADRPAMRHRVWPDPVGKGHVWGLAPTMAAEGTPGSDPGTADAAVSEAGVSSGR